MEHSYQVSVSDLSKRLSIIEADPKTAWKAATTMVRYLARCDRLAGIAPSYNEGWYTTANRAGYSKGNYRCTTVIADRNGLQLSIRN